MEIAQPEEKTTGPGQSAMRPNEKAFWALNWLRFILAIYLVLFHTFQGRYDVIEDTWFEAFLGMGNFATSVFFVLSGFLLTHAYVVKKNGREINKRSFFIARFSTLYPLHIAGLALALAPFAAAIVGNHGVTVPADTHGLAVRVLKDIEVFFALGTNLALLSAWNPYYLPFNTPSWSLSALACFYLVFPFIAVRIYRMKSHGSALVLLGVLFLAPGAIADILQRTDLVTDGLLHRNPLIRLPLFIAGMVLCALFAHSQPSGSRWRTPLLAAVIAATTLVGVNLQYQDSTLHIERNGLYFPASLAIIWLCVHVGPTLNERVKAWGERLGAASLPIFFLHAPLYAPYAKAEKFIRGALASPDWRLSSIVAAGKGLEPAMAFYPLYLVTLVVVCVLVQERFVTPLQAKIRNRYAPPPARAQQAQDVRTGT
ncbi:peptidoglycan/LPS O-acetylase OafA/YrhL [Pseudoduganella flava]|uniref:Acyltransferase family protein n=1 Tax=Pseudoduganella flava TaxID=871742 RepID=A0A562Q0V6_9BURK|nr:acyltransferase [Pseudoduganella flava]QGZ38156.1 acyltransferase family protein [Pseudoduganella flava]TWI50322.1 peptidoglycan/LPS O-acetylase OafA/YrhL [Pseudoduganella flava]